MGDQPPPGWIEDPERPGMMRYWNGRRFTEQRAPINGRQRELIDRFLAHAKSCRRSTKHRSKASALVLNTKMWLLNSTLWADTYVSESGLLYKVLPQSENRADPANPPKRIGVKEVLFWIPELSMSDRSLETLLIETLKRYGCPNPPARLA